MQSKIDRRTMLKSGAGAGRRRRVFPHGRRPQPTLRFAAVFSDKDIRADMMRMIAKDVEADVKIEPFLGGTLFKQGTELVALQRDNLEMGNIAPADIAKQVARVVAAHLRLPVPRREPPAGVLPQRPRRGVEEAGRGPGQDQDPRADVLRHAAGRPAREEEDQHARGHGRHQAAHAAGRRLAAARTLGRREPHADGLRRDLHRAADRRDRRAGQPAAERAEHEVLRGDVADRAHLARHRVSTAWR